MAVSVSLIICRKGTCFAFYRFPFKYSPFCRLLDVFPSYYGGFTCVCWSPDGMYVLTGGQDDLLSIWSLPDRQIVARCQGHDSWVTAVAFDPWRCDDRNYRFGSVGDDCKLLLWDFSVGMLHRPRGVSRLPYSVPTIECAPLCFSHIDKRVTLARC